MIFATLLRGVHACLLKDLVDVLDAPGHGGLQLGQVQLVGSLDCGVFIIAGITVTVDIIGIGSSSIVVIRIGLLFMGLGGLGGLGAFGRGLVRTGIIIIIFIGGRSRRGALLSLFESKSDMFLLFSVFWALVARIWRVQEYFCDVREISK